MEKDFNYHEVPYTFMHCIHTSCVRANDCLRYRVMQHATPDRASITIVNPVQIPENGNDCPHFFADQKARYALGITHLLDNIPHKVAVQIRNILYMYFQRNIYYRIRNQERLIKPAEQDYIRQVFLKKGINEEPVFDTYIEQYEW